MTAHPRHVSAALFGLALAACAQHLPTDTPGQPSADVGTTAPVREETASRFVGLIGTKAQHAPPFLGVPETNFYCLRSFVDRQTGETLHQLYVSDSYAGEERHWDAARDGAGHALRFVEISQERITCDGGCSYAEEFAAVIPESELRANTHGLKVIFTARSGAEKTITIAGSQITAQLAAIDPRQNSSLPAAASSSAKSVPAQQ
jgi:hypothetical protein